VLAGAALTKNAFLTMDSWLANVEGDSSNDPIEVKVARDKPLGAVDLCLTTTGATDAKVAINVGLGTDTCPAKFESSPRQAAGGPLAENIFKCDLKPVTLSDPDYGGATFTPDQAMRLFVAFPGSVCDWTKPGVGQVPVNPWTSFAAGPGGVPLGPSPVSRPFP